MCSSCDLDFCGHVLGSFIAMTWMTVMARILQLAGDHRDLLVVSVFGYFIASVELVYSPVL